MDLYVKWVDLNKLKLGGRVLLLHGTEDSTVPIALSNALNQELTDAGTTVDYRKYEGETHSGVVKAATKDALADAKKLRK